VADIATSGTVNKLTFINYAFGNVYQKNGGYECDMVTKLEPGATNPNAPDAGTGGDSYADYQRTPARTIGTAPAWDGKLTGNFYQLKQLKTLNPNLKIFISLGGWSWSKFFSAASMTDALRKQLVSSCVKMFIDGDLPVQDGRGGPGAAKGVFDGIDIDWEFPGGGGQPYNTVNAADKTNFTLLLAEFRNQLNAASARHAGKRFALTVAIGVGKDKIDFTEPAKYHQSLDWINAMTYDYHGGWDTVTNFHSHLYPDPAEPATGVARTYNSDTAINYLIQQGVPANKILLGIGFYGRGWAGVAAGPNGDGLYQPVSGPAPGKYEAGINDYKELKNMAGTRRVHPVTKQLYLYTGAGGQWWSYDDPAVIATKMSYVRSKGLGGAFNWELDGDTSTGELATAIWNGR
jgi:chitinase